MIVQVRQVDAVAFVQALMVGVVPVVAHRGVLPYPGVEQFVHGVLHQAGEHQVEETSWNLQVDN